MRMGSVAARSVESLGRETSPSLVRISRPGRGRSAMLHLLLAAALLTGREAWAAAGGQSGLSILKSGMGARPAALGQAYTALGDDVFAVGYNPAGLARLTRAQIGLQHGIWLQGANVESAAAAFPLSGGHTLGVSATLLSSGKIDRTFDDGTGNLDVTKSVGTFTTSDVSAGALYAHAGRSLSLGIQVKYLQSTVDDVTKATVAADAGFQTKDLGRVRLGASVLNVGGSLGADPLPTTARAGVMVEFSKRVRVPVDLVLPFDGSRVKIGGGIEFSPFDILTLRGGVQTGLPFVPGAGIGLAWHDLGLDYAFTSNPALKETHRINLSLRFGPVRG